MAGQGYQVIARLLKCARPVTDLVLDLRSQLGKCIVIASRYKDRIKSEASLSTRRQSNSAFASASAYVQDFSLTVRDRYGRNKSRTAVPLIRFLEFSQQLFDPLEVRSVFTRITRR